MVKNNVVCTKKDESKIGISSINFTFPGFLNFMTQKPIASRLQKDEWVICMRAQTFVREWSYEQSC